MMMQNKKAPRKKAYKNMSVSELVTCRKELALKIEQIDSVLNEAVEAISSAKITPRLKSGYVKMSNQYNDSAFIEKDYVDNAQVVISKEAPILPPVSRTAADQSSGFSIFDAEAAAREQAKAELDYIQNNTDVSLPEDSFDFNEDLVNSEIESLKSNIKDIFSNNV